MFLQKYLRIIMGGIAVFFMFFYVLNQRSKDIDEILGESQVKPSKQWENLPPQPDVLVDGKKVEDTRVPPTDQEVTKNYPEKKAISLAPKNESHKAPMVLPDHVLFEIKMKDWAVAFGDVLLGKINTQNPIKTGQYKPSSPRLWLSAEIPYVIDPDYPYKELVEDVIAYFHEVTPIRFVSHQGQKDGIIFKLAEEHCYSYLGRVGGFQPIFLSEQCRGPQIIHEILHALGFIHEQSRTDRDQYVEIHWNEIQPGYELQYTQVPASFMLAQEGSQFDYNSIMLYSAMAFAKDPSRPVMKSLTKQEIQPSQEGLSKEDIDRLYKLYGK